MDWTLPMRELFLHNNFSPVFTVLFSNRMDIRGIRGVLVFVTFQKYLLCVYNSIII